MVVVRSVYAVRIQCILSVVVKQLLGTATRRSLIGAVVITRRMLKWEVNHNSNEAINSINKLQHQ